MKLSVIIPVLNESASIVQTLTSLQQVLHAEDEIIVVDGGSDDSTVQLAGAFARVLTSPSGRARQMNAGASVANGDVYLFLHADTRLPDDARQCIETCASDRDAWGRFDVSLSGSRMVFRLIETMMNLRSCITRVATGDQAMFVTAGLFASVDGFDDLPLMEDVALSKKLRQQVAISCIRSRVITSSRRWEQGGVLRTVLLMWRLRFKYFLGTPARELVHQYYPQRSESSLLIVFAKAPVAGKANTRLIPLLGEQGAADLQRDLVRHRMQQFGNKASFDVQLHCAPDAEHELFQACHREYGIELYAQTGDGLGERMSNAFRSALAHYDKVVLIGTDAPATGMQDVMAALDTLDEADVAIKPAEDGGYVLIAMRRLVDEAFDGIDWGTAQVMQQTELRLNASACSWSKSEPGWDIDTAEDYQRYVDCEECRTSA